MHTDAMAQGLYIEGPIGSGKTTRLVDETLGLLTRHPSGSVLVLASNHYRQARFTEQLLMRLDKPAGHLPVFTYAGLVRNALYDWWPLVEARLAKSLEPEGVQIRPELTGMEDTEMILRWVLATSREKYPAMFEDFPGSDQSLMRQLLQRLRLRSENRLSRPEMQRRSEILGEICRAETAEVEKRFDRASYVLRTLDANKQLDIFHTLLEEEPVFAAQFTGIRHLVADDLDETTPAQQAFIEHLAPQLDTLILTADVDGGTRRGYLNAHPYGWPELKNLISGETILLSRDDAFYQAGQTLLANWRETEEFASLFSDPENSRIAMDDSAITRAEMLDIVTNDVLGLIAQGVSPGEIALVMPRVDNLGIYQLQHRLQRRGVNVQVLSGTRRPLDNPLCRAYIHLLQLLNSRQWEYHLSSWEMKTLLVYLLGLQYLDRESLDRLIAWVAHHPDHLRQEQQTAQADQARLLPDLAGLELTLPDWVIERYERLREWTETAVFWPFEKQFYRAFSDIITPVATDADKFDDLKRLIDSYNRQRKIFTGLLERSGGASDIPYERWWLAQVKTGTVADSPKNPPSPDPDAVIIGTPQKIIDFEITRDYQFWLDVSAREWARSDNAPLYNAWVHSSVWDEEVFDGSDNSGLMDEAFSETILRTRAGHISRTLMLLARRYVYCYASDLDDLGFTNNGLLKPRLVIPRLPAPGEPERAVLRDDQVPILEYESGTMAITAVPGAGKTFVNVELVLSLVDRGISPERILVLTYMDSAAKTLLSRLKHKLVPYTKELPVVSTIHSLAFRILTENDHALRLGFLPEDVTILDDYQRGEVLHRIADATRPESIRNVNDWQRAVDRTISHCKMQRLGAEELADQLTRHANRFRLLEFLPAYRLYEQTLRRDGAMDFTDLILKAIDLLENHADIRQRYQERFAVVIEDEAQDSSRLLQRFIQLIGGESPNLIRTGDTNQSITTTFSAADTSVFRDFIGSADKVVTMDHSGRSAPPVIDLANGWIEYANRHPGLKDAFQPVAMRAVAGQNPGLLYPMDAQCFDTMSEEDAFLVRRIQEIRRDHPDASIAVLARQNRQVHDITGKLHYAGIQAVSLSDQLTLNPVFNVILAFLKTLVTPSVDHQLALYEAMIKANLLAFEDERKDHLKGHPLFYLAPAQIGELGDEMLVQLYYDWMEFSRIALSGNVYQLILRMTDRLFTSVSDRSNGYLCALMADEILHSHPDLEHMSPLEVAISRFSHMQKSWKGKRGFSDLLSRNPNRFVQVMSLHKAKGQEFDVVLMPYLQKELFPTVAGDVRFEESDKLIKEIDWVLADGVLSDAYQEEKQREKIEEEARLVYVGLTRAKKALYASAHLSAMTRYQRPRQTEPSEAFGFIDAHIHQDSHQAAHTALEDIGVG